jgi:cell division septation protein DedD
MTSSLRLSAGSLRWLPLVLAGVSLLAGAIALRGSEPAQAIAPCVPWSNTADELSLLAQVQAWRDTNIAGSHQLTRSAPLNAAAAGYAQHLADTGGSGHFADGSDWSGRAINCGFASNSSGAAAGGEGVAEQPNAASALAQMTAHGGSGLYIPSNVGLPVKCVGVGSAFNGESTIWVIMLMARSGDCPQPVTGGPSETTPPTATNTPETTEPTNTPTNTATPTSTPTATPTPSPSANYGAVVRITDGWSLVTLPPGPLDDVLDVAEACFSSVYRQVGNGWLRYSPNVPSYVNNMAMADGGAYWIEGIADCGEIDI